MAELSGATVLLVEDEGLVALMIEDMLEELGLKVVASAAQCQRPANWQRRRRSMWRSST
jgi:CheY-like chemotaxis protein